MSLEVSNENYISLSSLAKKIGLNYKNAPQDFHKACLATESIHNILEALQHDYCDRQSSLWRDKRSSEALMETLSNCTRTMWQLEGIINKSSTLASLNSQAWNESGLGDDIHDLILIESNILYFISFFSVLQEMVGRKFSESVYSNLEIGLQEVIETVRKFAEKVRARRGRPRSASYDSDDFKVWGQLHTNLIEKGYNSQQIFECEDMVISHLATMREQGIIGNELDEKIDGETDNITKNSQNSVSPGHLTSNSSVGVQVLSTLSLELSKLLQERGSFQKLLKQHVATLRRRDGYIVMREDKWANQALSLEKQEELHTNTLEKMDKDIRERDKALACQALELQQQKYLQSKALEDTNHHLQEIEALKSTVIRYETENQNLQLNSGNLEKIIQTLQEDLKLMVSEYTNVDDEKNLFREVKIGRTDRVRFFLAKGVSANAISPPSGLSALHEASQCGFMDVAALLLDRGAYVDIRDRKRGRTPLHLAASSGREVVVRFLLERGARIAETCDEYWTPLHEAAKQGHRGVAEILVDKGANLDAKTNNNKTALDMAKFHRREDIVQLLLEKARTERTSEVKPS